MIENIEKYTKKATGVVTQYLTYILTVLIFAIMTMAVTLVVGFVGASIKDELFMAVVGFTGTILVYSVWLTSKRNETEATNEAYINNRDLYRAEAEAVSIDDWQEFIDEVANPHNRIEAIKDMCYKAKIDYKKLDKYIENTPAEFTSKQKRIVKKIKLNRIKYEHLTVGGLIYRDGRNQQVYSTKSTEQRMLAISIFQKVIATSVGMFLAIAISISETELNPLLIIIKIIMWVVNIFFAVYSGASQGYKSIAVHKKDYYAKLIKIVDEYKVYAKSVGKEVKETKTVEVTV